MNDSHHLYHLWHTSIREDEEARTQNRGQIDNWRIYFCLFLLNYSMHSSVVAIKSAGDISARWLHWTSEQMAIIMTLSSSVFPQPMTHTETVSASPRYHDYSRVVATCLSWNYWLKMSSFKQLSSAQFQFHSFIDYWLISRTEKRKNLFQTISGPSCQLYQSGVQAKTSALRSIYRRRAPFKCDAHRRTVDLLSYIGPIGPW